MKTCLTFAFLLIFSISFAQYRGPDSQPVGGYPGLGPNNGTSPTPTIASFAMDPNRVLYVNTNPNFQNTFTVTNTFSPTLSYTPTNTYTFTNTYTWTPTPTWTGSLTPTSTLTNTPTNTPSFTPTPTYTGSWIATATAAIWTKTPTFTSTNTKTNTPDFTPTGSYTPTSTYTLSYTPTPTLSYTKTYTPTLTWTMTNTPTAIASLIYSNANDHVIITPVATITPGQGTYQDSNGNWWAPMTQPSGGGSVALTPLLTPGQTPALDGYMNESEGIATNSNITSQGASVVSSVQSMSTSLVAGANAAVTALTYFQQQETSTATWAPTSTPTGTLTPSPTPTPNFVSDKGNIVTLYYSDAVTTAGVVATITIPQIGFVPRTWCLQFQASQPVDMQGILYGNGPFGNNDGGLSKTVTNGTAEVCTGDYNAEGTQSIGIKNYYTIQQGNITLFPTVTATPAVTWAIQFAR